MIPIFMRRKSIFSLQYLFIIQNKNNEIVN